MSWAQVRIDRQDIPAGNDINRKETAGIYQAIRTTISMVARDAIQ